MLTLQWPAQWGSAGLYVDPASAVRAALDWTKISCQNKQTSVSTENGFASSQKNQGYGQTISYLSNNIDKPNCCHFLEANFKSSYILLSEKV